MSGKLLYISPCFEHRLQGGREKLSKLHLDCLRDLLGNRLDEYMLDGQASTGWRAIGGRIDGVTRAAEQAILARLAAGEHDRVLLNGSNLGLLARAIKQHAPKVEILTFCHNVESRFFAGALRTRPGPRTLAVLIANFLAERSAARFSDRLITLSERDGKLFGRLFGRGATDILPMALADQLSANPPAPAQSKGSDYLLFVGGGFYANREGICWFAREVAPALTIRTLVVGHGMDDLKVELAHAPNVELIGAVDDLEPWYLGAKAVIAPIFDGSGMKTKVAEALMFGQRVVGTREAFSGYEQVAAQAGRQCDTKEEFIRALREIEASPTTGFSPETRLLYERYFSYQAARGRLSNILGEPSNGLDAGVTRSVHGKVGHHGNIDPATVTGFGEEWAAFDQSSLDPDEWGELFANYFSIFPFDQLPPDAEGFDLGCGSGRWAAGVAPRVGRLHCIDPSDKALDVARTRLASHDNVRFHLADSETMPLPDDSQDFGYSLGVLHHIPDTGAAMRRCVDKLKPGAPFLVYLYYALDQRSGWFRALWRTSDALRRVISRMPFGPRKLVTSGIAATIYWPLARISGGLEKAGFNVSKLPLSFYRNSSFYTMRTDALDRFGTRLEQRFTRDQIRQMMDDSGLTDIVFLEGEPYWVACGRKR